MRRSGSNRQSGKSALASSTNARNHGSVEMPPVETVVARLETLTKLLHESSQTRLTQVFMEIQVLADDLRKVGPYLEQAYPDTLDRVMASMRDASASSALPPSLRLAVFELVELRASKWLLPSDTCNYYRQRRILKDGSDSDSLDLGIGTADSEAEHQPYTPQVSQKGFRQEILIKNSDSGKVMGVRGRRISKIEKLSDTIVSFEKVDPLAKERVLSINGYTQQSINLAKQLIQETIARNSSPVFDGAPIVPMSQGSGIRQPLLPTPDIISGQNGLGAEKEASALDHILSGLDNYLNNNNNIGSSSDPVAPLFNYTVTIGSQTLRVSGNNLSLVQEAKLTLDDYFAQKYPQMFYTMHVRTRSMSNCEDEEEDDEYEDPMADINYEETTRPADKSSTRFSKSYDRSELLSLSGKVVKPPDFSHLDQAVRDNIILQKPRFTENLKLGINQFENAPLKK